MWPEFPRERRHPANGPRPRAGSHTVLRAKRLLSVAWDRVEFIAGDHGMRISERKAAMAERSWGYWTEHKLSMLADYLPRFTTASSRARTTVYLDLFAGDIENISMITGEAIPGSPKVALDTAPPFGKVVLFELPTEATRLRKQLQEDYPGRDFAVYPGDCNTSIDTALRDLAPLASAPTFAFIDQYAAEIHWTTLVKLARFKRRSPYKVELWILFAASMLPRGLGQDDPDRVAEFASRITAMYGTPVWRVIHDARQDGRLTAADMRYEPGEPDALAPRAPARVHDHPHGRDEEHAWRAAVRDDLRDGQRRWQPHHEPHLRPGRTAPAAYA
jgi:three-Cys-motif partner protein